MLVVLVAGALYTLTSQLEQASRPMAREEHNAIVLARAKEALIGHAAGFALPTPACNPIDPNCANRAGDLPCPDNWPLAHAKAGTPGMLPGDNSAMECGNGAGNNSRLGRLPSKTLGLTDDRDSASERLWYAVSLNFKNNPQEGILNSSQTGTITIRDNAGNIINDGTAGGGVVAVIIAPGAPLTRQDGLVQTRGIANENIASNYLDIATVGAVTEDNANFSDATGNGLIAGLVKDANGATLVNDRFITITRDEIMAAIGQRLAKETLVCLQQFPAAGREYPWPVPLATPVSLAAEGRTGNYFGRFPLTQEDQNLQQNLANSLNQASTAQATLTAATTVPQQQAALTALVATLNTLRDYLYAAYDALTPVRDAASNAQLSTISTTQRRDYANTLLTAMSDSGFDSFTSQILDTATSTLSTSRSVQNRLNQYLLSPSSTTASRLKTAVLTGSTSYANTLIDPNYAPFPLTPNAAIAGEIAIANGLAIAAGNAANAATTISYPPANATDQAIYDAAVATAQAAIDHANNTLLPLIRGYLLNTSAAQVQEAAAAALFANESVNAQATKTSDAALQLEGLTQTLRLTINNIALLPPASGALPAAVASQRTAALAAADTALSSIASAKTNLSNGAVTTQAVTDTNLAYAAAAALAETMQGNRVNIAASSITLLSSQLSTQITLLQAGFTNDNAAIAKTLTTTLYQVSKRLVTQSNSSTINTQAARNTVGTTASTASASLQAAIDTSVSDPQLAARQAQAILDLLAAKAAADTLASAITGNGDNVGYSTLKYWNDLLTAYIAAGDTTNASIASAAVRREALFIYVQANTFLRNAVEGTSPVMSLISSAKASADANATSASPDVSGVLSLLSSAISGVSNLLNRDMSTTAANKALSIVWPAHPSCDWIKAATTSSGSSWQGNEWQRWILVQLNNPSIAGNLTVNGAGNYPIITLAPGPLLGGRTGDSLDPTHYLDGANATGPTTKQYITGSPSATFNDRLAY